MRHLANAHSVTGPASGNTRRLFLSFGGTGCTDRYSDYPLDRVLTYKNLIYLLNLQIFMIGENVTNFLHHMVWRYRRYIINL